MEYTAHYQSPLGGIFLAGDENRLTGLWFEGQKYFARHLDADHEERDLPLFRAACRWLDIYFSGKQPDFSIPLHLKGTDFQKEVWQILLSIPYGKTTTYKKIAEQLADKKNLSRMSAQAVGGAIGRNRISVIIPCHRVIGTDGSLTGYAGGIDKKAKLLTLENTDVIRTGYATNKPPRTARIFSGDVAHSSF